MTKKIHNPARAIRGVELESMLIIMFCGLMDIEKGKDDLRVIHTAGTSISLQHHWLFSIGKVSFECSVIKSLMCRPYAQSK